MQARHILRSGQYLSRHLMPLNTVFPQPCAQEQRHHHDAPFPPRHYCGKTEPAILYANQTAFLGNTVGRNMPFSALPLSSSCHSQPAYVT
ncbi:hypothetical protein PAL_GLEAN10001165 [Pteropus alecto]|uniref:Uncharacterized protein n=1 Tax=Pteropus alecto TaxID=9402 RepID=L5K971_PTEAL|nr:hypothetical protein PAL_GLEAN10001165 [Pteropus alecto]